VTIFIVQNETGGDVLVGAEFLTTPSLPMTLVESGEQVELKSSGGPLEYVLPSNSLKCVSVYDIHGSKLLYQQSEISDASWDSSSGAARVRLRVLTVGDGMLSVDGVEDKCGD